MQTQGRITHEANVNIAGSAVDLIAIESAVSVILGDAGAVAERFTEANVMVEPVWTTGPCARQTHTAGREHRAHNIIFRIPVPQPTAEEQREDSFDVVLNEFNCRAVVVLPGIAKA